MIEMKRNERVKQCTVIDEMESNYVNVDSLWSPNRLYLLISVWKPVQLRCWIRNSCINEPRGMFLILELSLCRIVMNFLKSVFKFALREGASLDRKFGFWCLPSSFFLCVWILIAEYNSHLLIRIKEKSSNCCIIFSVEFF